MELTWLRYALDTIQDFFQNEIVIFLYKDRLQITLAHWVS